MIGSLFYIIVFPGFVFLGLFGLVIEFVDRKLYARLQNRVGPPFFQPLADLIKLASKEEIIPCDANPNVFKAMPVLALTAAITASFYMPLWNAQAQFAFSGDVVVTLYLLTLPTLSLFLGGWYSTSLYSKLGAVRAITQLFAYEVPLFMSILSPALLADTWSLSEISEFYAVHPYFWIFNLIGFFVALVAMLIKLEKVPFDIPEAETEIVAGTLTEYSGRLLGLFKLALNIETVVLASLLAAVFLPFRFGFEPAHGFMLYLVKVFFIISMLALARTVFARLRIDQLMRFCWKYLAPLAFVQLLIDLVIKGVIMR